MQITDGDLVLELQGDPGAVMTDTSCAMADLPLGARGRVAGVVGGTPAISRRLADLGFTPGTEVEVVRRAPLGEPIMYRVKDYEVCMRRAQARCVYVIKVDR